MDLSNNNTDLVNSNLLDDDFSNAIGSCGLPPTCLKTKIIHGTRKSCKKVGKRQVCINIPTVKTVVNQSCVDSRKRYTDCVSENARQLAAKTKATVKKAATTVKKTVKKAATTVKTATKKTGVNIKKKAVKLKDKVGAKGKAFRNKFRSVMRKGILFNIKNNIHGNASKLYPAVATDSEVANKKYKKSFVGISRVLYNQVANKWKSLGGNENDLKNAIRQGSSKKFLKAPYKSANGDDSMALYLHYTPSNRALWENPNTTFYYNAGGEDGEDAADFGYSDESVYVDTATGVVDEQTGIEEVPSQEEEVKGIRAFFAWLKGLFHKNQAVENPYAEGTPEYIAFESEKNADAGNEPDPSEANDPDITDLENKGGEDGAGTTADENAGDETEEDGGEDDTILGMPKTAFWIGVGAIVLIGGYFGYKKFIAKK